MMETRSSGGSTTTLSRTGSPYVTTVRSASSVTDSGGAGASARAAARKSDVSTAGKAGAGTGRSPRRWLGSGAVGEAVAVADEVARRRPCHQAQHLAAAGNRGAEADHAVSAGTHDVDRAPLVADPALQVDELPAVHAARPGRTDEAPVPDTQRELRPHVDDRRRPADQRAEFDVVLGADRRLHAKRPGAVSLGDHALGGLDAAVRRHQNANLLAALAARDAAGELDALTGRHDALREPDRHRPRLDAAHVDRAALVGLDRAAVAVCARRGEVVGVALPRLEQRRLERAGVGDDLSGNGVLVRPRDRVVGRDRDGARNETVRHDLHDGPRPGARREQERAEREREREEFLHHRTSWFAVSTGSCRRGNRLPNRVSALLERPSGNVELVARAADRHQPLGAGRAPLDLPPDVGYVDVRGVLVADVLAAPEVPHDLGPAEDLAGPLGQKREQPELGRSELDGLAIDRHLVAREVEPEPPDLPYRSRAVPTVELAAAQDRAHAADELRPRERLGDVIVGAELETEDAVDLGVTCGQHQDRHDASLGTQAPADLRAGDVGQHHVEDEDVVVVGRGTLEGRLPVADRFDVEAPPASAKRTTSWMPGSSSTTRMRALMRRAPPPSQGSVAPSLPARARSPARAGRRAQ